jgi:hypothetical protein
MAGKPTMQAAPSTAAKYAYFLIKPLPGSVPGQLEADPERRADCVLFHDFAEGAVVPDGHADAIDAIQLKPGANPIERRIDRFRQVQCGVAGQILRRRELPSISQSLLENSTPALVSPRNKMPASCNKFRCIEPSISAFPLMEFWLN